MNESIVRVTKIELEHVKNVTNGIIEMRTDECFINSSADIVGLYGQNGSGKSALIDALEILKKVLSGDPIPRTYEKQIQAGKDYARFLYGFYVCKDDKTFEVEYEFKIKRDKQYSIIIEDEVIKFKSDQQSITQRTLIDTTVNDKGFLFTPDIRFKEIMSKNDNQVQLQVGKQLAVEKRQSFVFSEKVYNILKASYNDETYSKLLKELREFGRVNMLVVCNRFFGEINSSKGLPFFLKLKGKTGRMTIQFDVTVIEEEYYDLFTSLIEQLNILIQTIIPGLKLGSDLLGEEKDKDNNTLYKLSLHTIRDDIKIPIRYESDGIIKILSILSALSAMYNKENVFVAIDEFDSGIFEYLLGEFLEVMKDTGKGQLIFTSHNLRPLEILDKDKIYFTTTNPNNRYIRFKNIKTTNNLRDVYLRAIQLGGQAEKVYEETEAYKISRAFRVAGKE
jgi:AAA15 family ATPase/GTPase